MLQFGARLLFLPRDAFESTDAIYTSNSMVEVLVIFDVKKGDLSTFVCLDMKLGVIKFGEITSSYLISEKSE